MGHGELVQTVRKRRAGDLHEQIVGNREVRQTLPPWRVFLCEVDLAFGPERRTPLAHSPLQGAQYVRSVLARVAALDLFEQGDRVELHIALQ